MGGTPSEIEQNRTKIVCTIGPASSTVGILREMVIAGMDVARINFAHGDQDSNLALLDKIRAAAEEVGKHIAILQDLQGPKLRIGELPGDGLELLEGQLATLRSGVHTADPGVIPVPYERFAHDLERGDHILIADGTRELEVLEVRGDVIKAKVLLGGRIISHKGMNVPTVSLSVESMTDKDKDDLAFGLRQNIDFVALSYVRSRDDVRILRRLVESYLPPDTEPPHIIVKIEKHEAVEHIDEILEESDGIMIARGDLGLETPVSQVPIHQKELIAKCVVAGKPVITATQMLASMEQSPRPTRAEVSDVANAVIDHTDATMLSGETATGRFPVQAVKTMAEIIEQTEESPLDNLKPEKDSITQTVPSAVAAAAVELVHHVDARAILITTHSGYSARMAARFRPEVSMFAVTNSPRTRNQLLLSWGIVPFLTNGKGSQEEMVTYGLRELQRTHDIPDGSNVVVMSGLKKEKGRGYNSAVRVVEI